MGQKMFGGERARTITLALLVLFCMGLTYYYHFVRGIDLVFTHFFYVPIVLAGFWWWRRAIWVAAILGGWVIVSHILAGLDMAVTADILRCAMFIVVGLVAGILRKQCDAAEQRALRETRDYLDSLIRHSSVPIIVWDNQGKIKVFNDAFEGLTGYGAEEMAGRSPEVLIPEEKRTEALQKIEATLKGDSWQAVEIPIRCKDGRIAICLWNSANIYSPDDKTLMATLAQGLDITERKRAEEALRQTKEKLLSILNSTTDYCYIVSKDYRVEFMNKAGVEKFGDRSGDVCYMALFNRESPCPWCTAAEVQEGRTVRWEHSSPTLAGTFDIIDSPLANADGTISKLAIWRDISERKCTEDEIKASLKAKEVLLKEVHHRVKNNLQIISSLLNLQLGYIKDKGALELFKESRNRIKSMAFIHEELYRSKQLSNVNFTEYIRNLAATLFRSYGVDPNTVALKIEADDVLLGVDAAIPCGLIVNELVSNALKHAFPEGRKGEIRIGFRRQNDNGFALTVCDNGIGFPKDVDFRNTGSLGLQIVCTLTDQMHGIIELRGVGGTEFRIMFTEAAGK